MGPTTEDEEWGTAFWWGILNIIAWLAPTCGSRGWLAGSKTRRSAARPQRNINDSWVYQNNLLADWLALILRKRWAALWLIFDLL